MRDHSKEYIAAIEEREREATGIKNLKIGYNRVFGYYIEVTRSYQKDVYKRQVLQYQTHTVEADGATASFLFCGPTGVGKTLAAKLTAEVLFDSKSFIRIDLSEYSDCLLYTSRCV